MEFDTSQFGLRAVLKDYQEEALKMLWEHPEPQTSRQVWIEVNKRLNDETISRASIINFLEAMREDGVLKGEEATGKGGHHWLYNPAMNETGFKVYIAQKVLGNLERDFPEETRQAISEISAA